MDPRDVDKETWEIINQNKFMEMYTYWDSEKELKYYRNILLRLQIAENKLAELEKNK